MTTTRVTTLPAEILSLIFGEVSRPTTAISSLPDAAQQLYNASEWADLRALRLTCQRFNGLIEPILFSDVMSTFADPDCSRRHPNSRHFPCGGLESPNL